MNINRGLARQHGSELSLIHRILDAVLILAVLGVIVIYYDKQLAGHYYIAGAVAVGAYLFVAEWFALFGSWRAGSLREEYRALMSTWIITIVILLLLAFISKASIQYSRVAITLWLLVTPMLLILERAILRVILRKIRANGINSRAVAIAGNGKCASRLIDAITEGTWMGLEISGIYDENEVKCYQGNTIPFFHLKELIVHAQEGRIDSVYIAYPMNEEEKISNLVSQLADSTVSVYVVPDVFVSDLFHARWSSIGPVPLVSIFESPLYGTNSLVKRMEDLILGSLILILISPIMLIISAAVKLTSPGPVFFKQRRFGLNGQIIEVWKFRSMSVMEDGPNIPQAQRNDPRITPLGSFLRKTSLDELPQFINVLQGRMSIVGPRPHALAHNEQYRKLIHGYMLRHKVKPGITGWAQVNGWRGETDTIDKMEKRVQYDLYYINNWSLPLDLKIILMTVFGGMRGKNAY